MSTALMTKADLATRVQCHPRTIDNLLARKEGPPPIRIGGLARFGKTISAWPERLRGEAFPQRDGAPGKPPGSPGRRGVA